MAFKKHGQKNPAVFLLSHSPNYFLSINIPTNLFSFTALLSGFV